MNGYEGMCVREGKWQIKLLSEFFFQFTFNILQMTQSQKIITCRVLKNHECVWVGEGFLRNDKWQIKLLSAFFPIYIQLFTNNSNSKRKKTLRVSKIHEWIWGDVCDCGKFLKEWQVTDIIIEWIFFQFMFNLLQMTQTQKIITRRVSKIHEWIWRDVWVGKVS